VGLDRAGRPAGARGGSEHGRERKGRRERGEQTWRVHRDLPAGSVAERNFSGRSGGGTSPRANSDTSADGIGTSTSGAATERIAGLGCGQGARRRASAAPLRRGSPHGGGAVRARRGGVPRQDDG